MIDKKELLASCVAIIDEKLALLQMSIDGYKQDLLSEAKSSAGDKHETGRAMLQLEMEKLGQQHQTILLQKQALQKIDITSKKKIQIGSLVGVNNVFYFLAISIGQVTYQNIIYRVVSANSPVGKEMLGKQKNEMFTINGKKQQITEVY